MIHITALLMRFRKICTKQKRGILLNPLSVADKEAARKLLLNSLQKKYFESELKNIDALRGKGSWSLKRLDPFWSTEDSFLRVGGRLKNTTTYSIANPTQSAMTWRIIEFYHSKTQHSGKTTTLAEVRSCGFWVVSGNSLVKKLVFLCVRCQFLRGKFGEQKMANLPFERLS